MKKILTGHVIRDHVLVGGIAAVLLLPWFGPWNSLLFWSANVLIDLDHYLKFLQFTGFRVFDMNSMFRYHEEVFEKRYRPDFIGLEIFHTAEFVVLVGFVSYGFLPALQPVFWGILFHVVIDVAHLIKFRMLNKRAHSVLEYFWRRRRMRDQGMDPDLVFFESSKALRLSGPQRNEG